MLARDNGGYSFCLSVTLWFHHCPAFPCFEHFSCFALCVCVSVCDCVCVCWGVGGVYVVSVIVCVVCVCVCVCASVQEREEAHVYMYVWVTPAAQDSVIVDVVAISHLVHTAYHFVLFLCISSPYE